MIYKFEVDGFKGFSERVVFDLSHQKNYEFNQNCIANGVVRKSIIYGINGIGKSNVGLAIFDIVAHLTDFNLNKSLYNNYINAKNKTGLAKFKYHFKFGDDIVTYEYFKKNVKEFTYECLTINSKIVAELHRDDGKDAFFNLPGAESLNTDVSESNISIINYIKNNANLVDSRERDIFFKFISFVDKMLYFRSLETNHYLGLEMGSTAITPDIVSKGNLKDFEGFLNKAGVECKLSTVSSFQNDEIIEDIAFDFGDKKIPIFSIASTGTKSLCLFYFWLQRIRTENCVSFVFIDEFDAYYHHKLSVLIIEMLRDAGAQVILTTHNTNIMSNEFLRPDCYFIMDNKGISPLYMKTDKELREGHNIEKMYKAGSFDG